MHILVFGADSSSGAMFAKVVLEASPTSSIHFGRNYSTTTILTGVDFVIVAQNRHVVDAQQDWAANQLATHLAKLGIPFIRYADKPRKLQGTFPDAVLGRAAFDKYSSGAPHGILREIREWLTERNGHSDS